jgi:apolipoprotein N-acyltransferase
MFPPFFMLPLGFVIFPLLIKVINQDLYKKTLLNFFYMGFCYGLGFLLIYLSWIYSPFLVDKSTKPFAILAVFLPIFLSIFFGLSFLFYKFSKNFLYIVLITPFVLIFTEILISSFLYGFPWLTNSLILSNNLFGFYLIKYSGTIPSGYLIISIFLIPIILIELNKVIEFKNLILIIYAPLIFIFIITLYYSFSPHKDHKKKINISTHQILSPINNANKNIINQKIINIIKNSTSDYIIFAENNFPYIITEENLSKLNRYTKDKAKIIIGATFFKKKHYYNTFLLLEKESIQYFDKKILVPFGEFLPFRKYLKFMESISGTVDFERGNMNRVLKTKDNLSILPIICYEIIFDQIFNNINTNKIDILINITNDSWFGKKIGPYQHFYLTRIKSLIANKPLVRVSNNGISAIIDQNGHIIKSSRLNKVSNLNANLKITNNISHSILHSFFSYFLVFIFFIILIVNRKDLNAKY